MSEFELSFSFYGLLLGLSVAAIVSGLAEAIGSRRDVAIGLLTPLLALFVLLDISSFWIFAFRARDSFQVDFATMYLWLAVAVAYFLAASLVFPRHIRDWPVLNDHYWAHKKFVLPGVMAANAVTLIHAMLVRDDFFRGTGTIIIQALYWVPVIVLLFSKWRRLDRALLVYLAIHYLGGAFILKW